MNYERLLIASGLETGRTDLLDPAQFIEKDTRAAAEFIFGHKATYDEVPQSHTIEDHLRKTGVLKPDEEWPLVAPGQKLESPEFYVAELEKWKRWRAVVIPFKTMAGALETWDWDKAAAAHAEMAKGLNGSTNGHHAPVRASEVVEEPITWHWPDRIPLGAGTLIEGDGGTGKTTLTCDLIARTTTGEPWPDSIVERRPRNVLVCTAEDSWNKILVPRLRLAGADLARVFFAPDLISLPRDIAIFERWIVEADAALSLMDPLSAYLSLTGGKSWDEPSVRQALQPVYAVAERHEAAVLGIRHHNKDASMKAAYRGLGSVGFGAFARAVHITAPDPRDAGRYVLACSKANWGPKPPSLAYRIDAEDGVSRIEWLGTASMTADELLRPAQQPMAVERAEEFLTDYLADGEWHPVVDIRQAARLQRLGEHSLDQASRELAMEKKNVARAWVWRLPVEED